MGKLTAAQLAFLRKQGVALSQVLDGSGLSRIELKRRMDILEKKFYFGGSPCQLAGHTLRTKAGHCIQCDTSKIAYQLRSSRAGYIYVAHSSSGSCCKIGTTRLRPAQRVSHLNRTGYGGVSDWLLVHSKYFAENAGATEFSIHARLAKYQRTAGYQKDNASWVECREVFFCSGTVALSAFSR